MVDGWCVLVCMCVCVYLFFFFFQAEDGIRDWSVTGVQTCALPIWACKKREATPTGILNPSSKFAVCNSMLSECTNGTGEYCLFGYKWGTTDRKSVV